MSNTERLDQPLEHSLQDVALTDVVAPECDQRLYNFDIAPSRKQGRTWSSYNIFTLWANDVHSLGNYTFAIGLFALGLGAWQILLAMGFGSLFLLVLLTISGFVGYKVGVPFPVMSRISFGVRGAHIPALFRGGVAIAWFGIQTYLASLVCNILVLALFPGAKVLTEHKILGLNHLGWICFAALWLIQVIIACYGIEMVRKFEAYSGPIILVTFLIMAVAVIIQAKGHITWEPQATRAGKPWALHGWDMWHEILAGASGWVAIYGTFVLNFCDFTRGAKSKRSVVVGNVAGIPVNMLFFGCIVLLLAGGRFSVDGHVIAGPEDVVQTFATPFLVLACLALVVLTIGVNLMANFVAPAYALTNLSPKKLNFRRAAIISGVIGFVILPWNLYNSPAVINYFLGGLGAVLGPLFGIVMADYWVLRKQKVNVPDLYTFDPNGDYYYTKGVNKRAVIALVPSALISIAFAFSGQIHELHALSTFGPFSWFIAAGIAFVLYLIVADRSRTFREVDGEAIAVQAHH
ncbi:MAG TPA: NCS1 family nucleobase:cation symporter-1 [Flexivirga sp.]|uniref:NCS1 family nucleobase:cation symporter-1 n=1 Tax=Flexivirga sp. TaxID=1962927 RepID=UPI002C80DCCE|nr:NCS1 family nucleobase:cation symporter-1 [Flexivirga sp.]HWC24071.1 NCS1 family nucleobase:cation symporter-1 [Flexivirga sp.]